MDDSVCCNKYTEQQAGAGRPVRKLLLDCKGEVSLDMSDPPHGPRLPNLTSSVPFTSLVRSTATEFYSKAAICNDLLKWL